MTYGSANSPAKRLRQQETHADETAPLLSDHDAVYGRFTPTEKIYILTMVSFCGLMSLFVSETFVPSIPQIAKDLDTTGAVVSLAVSVSVFATATGSLAGAAYSTFYGRRPIYLVGLPLLVFGSLGVGLARTVPELMIWRFVQSFGCSPGFSVGAGVIGDIYKLEERGTAMGIFLSAVLLGPVVAPLIGGFAAHYSSWRIVQYCLGFVSLVLFICMLFIFPETSHPGSRGVDKARREKEGTGVAIPWFVNPLSPLGLLRSPNLLLVSISGFFVLLTDYVLLIPLAYTIGAKYGITNEFIIGACFLPCGLGNMIGAPIAGRLSDKIAIEWRDRRGGIWYPEDRLRATFWGSLVLTPLSILISGWLVENVDGTIGLIGNLVCLFLNGLGVDLVLAPSSAYVVDVMHSRSAESMAAAGGFRAFILSFAISGLLPAIETYGVFFTDGACAILAWLSFIILVTIIKYGEELRSWKDIGYSTINNN